MACGRARICVISSLSNVLDRDAIHRCASAFSSRARTLRAAMGSGSLTKQIAQLEGQPGVGLELQRAGEGAPRRVLVARVAQEHAAARPRAGVRGGRRRPRPPRRGRTGAPRSSRPSQRWARAIGLRRRRPARPRARRRSRPSTPRSARARRRSRHRRRAGASRSSAKSASGSSSWATRERLGERALALAQLEQFLAAVEPDDAAVELEHEPVLEARDQLAAAGVLERRVRRARAAERRRARPRGGVARSRARGPRARASCGDREAGWPVRRALMRSVSSSQS